MYLEKGTANGSWNKMRIYKNAAILAFFKKGIRIFSAITDVL